VPNPRAQAPPPAPAAAPDWSFVVNNATAVFGAVVAIGYFVGWVEERAYFESLGAAWLVNVVPQTDLLVSAFTPMFLFLLLVMQGMLISERTRETLRKVSTAASVVAGPLLIAFFSRAGYWVVFSAGLAVVTYLTVVAALAVTGLIRGEQSFGVTLTWLVFAFLVPSFVERPVDRRLIRLVARVLQRKNSSAAGRRAGAFCRQGMVDVVEQIGIVQVVNVVAEQAQNDTPPQVHAGTNWQNSPAFGHEPLQPPPAPHVAGLELDVLVDVEVVVPPVPIVTKGQKLGAGASLRLSPDVSFLIVSPPNVAQYCLVSTPTKRPIATAPLNGVISVTPLPVQLAFTTFGRTSTVLHGSAGEPAPL